MSFPLHLKEIRQKPASTAWHLRLLGDKEIGGKAAQL